MDETLVDHRDSSGAFRRLSVPTAISMLADQLLGIADTIVIGTMGPPSLAAATAATTCFVALAFLVIGFMSGIGIIAAQRIGARDMDGFGRTVRSGILVPLCAAAIVCAAGTVLARAILHGMIGGQPTADAGAAYLTVRLFSLISIAVTGTLITGLGAAGNSKFGVVILAIINVVHIPLLLILALGWGTHHPFGIAGAGISSLLAESIACVYAVWYVYRRKRLRVFASNKFDLRLSLRCASLGSPEAVFLFAMMVPDAVIVTLLAPLGALIVSAYRALIVVSDLTFVVPSPLQSAVQTVVGQRLGAGDVQGAKEFFKQARVRATWLTIGAAAICAACAWPAAYLFTLNAQVATLAALPLAVHMSTLPIKGWSMVSMAPIRASGDTRFSLIVGLLTAVFVLPAAFIFVRVLHFGLWGVPAAWIFAWTARAVVTAIKLRGESWTRRTLLAS